MTSKTKYILLGATGLCLGGAFVLFVAIVAGIGYMASRAEDNRSESSVPSFYAEKTMAGGAIAPELVGKWHRSEGGSQIDSTGKTQYGGGAHFTYQFFADGTVDFVMDKKILTILQCRIAETKAAQGRASISGDMITLNFGEVHHAIGDSCETSDNFEKFLPAETAAFKWRLKNEDGKTRLCLEEKDGEMCYDQKDS
jgi:hypothetical protein